MGLALFLNDTNSNNDARSPVLAQLISVSIVCLNVVCGAGSAMSAYAQFIRCELQRGWRML